MWTSRTHRAPSPARPAAQSGVALLTALALLVLFSMLGTAYIRYMSIENERTDFEIRVVRARLVASSGAYAAVAELEAAVTAGKAPPASLSLEFPVYGARRGVSLGFEAYETRRASADVTVSDESGKINPNHATPAVLQAVLGVDEAAAARILTSLPNAGDEGEDWLGGANRTWLLSVDDLVQRGLLSAEAAVEVDRGLLTFSSVADHTRPRGYLNVNAASPEVLAVVLGVDIETARAVGAAGPYASVADLAAAAGRAPGALSLPMGALGVVSRCFRVVSNGAYANVDEDGHVYRASQRHAEAVVTLDAAGKATTRLWREGPGRYEDAGVG